MADIITIDGCIFIGKLLIQDPEYTMTVMYLVNQRDEVFKVASSNMHGIPAGLLGIHVLVHGQSFAKI